MSGELSPQVETGLRSLSGTGMNPLEEAEARLKLDMQRVHALDEQVFLQLTQLKSHSRLTSFRPLYMAI